MDPGDLNPGLIVGVVTDEISGSPIEGARAILTRIVGDDSQPEVRTYWPSGVPDTSVWAETDDDGVFILTFGFEVVQLANLLGRDPFCHVSVIGPAPSDAHRTVTQYGTKRKWDLSLYLAISLRRVADGGIPDFRQPSAIAKSVASEAAKYCWQKKKKIGPFLRIMKPETEMVGLLGFISTSLKPTYSLVGQWQVKVDQWSWIYEFDANGGVRWTDPLNNMTGQGSWTTAGDRVTTSWAPQSKTTEEWYMPVNPSNQTGKCFMDETFPLNAVKIEG